ncbi:HD domain-containing phosphohydrolase [Rhodoferax sp.]|uniref:HD domain-containing phosphohydrolase n=1 Tax=Rhodoferax sp. TaxID=50421 RepID=UPI00284481D3|nr:HD domain-containing phosphohydrolase [Rhodoferax sp.]MDR3369784.1 HD domain-containing protein [Rhodoferax sp.]
MTSFRINLHEAIYSLADALDLVGVTHIHHGKRVAFIAAEIAKRSGWAHPRMDDLFQAAILHDCGVSKTLVHARLAQFQWENEAEHCVQGAELLQSCELLSQYSNFIRHHHTHWEQLESLDLAVEEKLAANCIYLADRVDIACLSSRGESVNLLLIKDEVRSRIFKKRGTWFEPSLVDRFMEVSSNEGFWFSLEGDHASNYVSRWVFDSPGVEIGFSELRNLVRVFSRIVDAKSTFTREHSEGVASLSRHIGELFELPERSCEMLELAGLLHDLGKLRIPDELLEKPGKLTHYEYSDVKRHSFDTYNILKDIHGLEEVALWAGQHHERIDGSGYPYHHANDEISFESRIIATADVFQALAQNRPYRGSLPPAEISAILNEEALNGRLDSRIVQKIDRHFDSCHRAAMAS